MENRGDAEVGGGVSRRRDGGRRTTRGKKGGTEDGQDRSGEEEGEGELKVGG